MAIRSSSGASCSVYGCMNKTTNKKLTFFRLPSNSEVRNQWLQLMNRPDLLSKENIKPASYKVCSAHFEESEINIIKQLKVGALPTKCLPKQCDEEYRYRSILTKDKSVQTDNSFLMTIKNAQKLNNVDMEISRKRNLSITQQETEAKQTRYLETHEKYS